ncbi:MAG: hypothetical protein JWO15_3604 [Sphingomonadales bacterium]|nr:hypothetical protein [Sphingomonadales bacterium]
MTADLICLELAFIFQYLEIRYKKTNLTYTNAGQRQHTFYVFHNDNPMSFEEWLVADTRGGQPVIHCDNISFSTSGVERHVGRLESFDVANLFYDNQVT